MKRTLSLLAAALLVLPASAQAEEGASVHQTLIDAKSPSIVHVKMVISISGTQGGRSVNQDVNSTATGIVVDPSGLIMTSTDALTPPRPAQVPPGMWRRIITSSTLKLAPTNIRIVFPGDETEYPAILGAKDTKLGLAFLLMKDLKDRDLKPVDLAAEVKPAVGMELYGVTRLGQGFDHAPACDKATIIGKLTKPRKVWLLSGAGNFVAEPLYDASGVAAGIVINQEGATSNTRMRTCLLPLGVARSTIKRSLKVAQDALEEALEAEAEAAEEAKEEDAEGKDDAPKKDDASKKADEPKKDDAPKKADEPKKDDPKKDDGA